MVLKTVHDKLDEIPEKFRELYTEKNGKFELTGITGLKTEADVARVQTSLEKERNEHKATKEKLKLWGDLDPEETHKTLDRVPELEKAAKGKIDENALDEMANKRADAILRTKLGPVERELAAAKKERDELKTSNAELTVKEHRRHIADAVRKVAGDLEPTAVEDAIDAAVRVMVFDPETESVRTRDDVKGITPGLDAATWLPEMRQQKPHWWKPSQGGGAKGNNSSGGGFAKNPWTKENWSLTEQGNFIKQHGMAVAEKAAKEANSAIGQTRPAEPPKK